MLSGLFCLMNYLFVLTFFLNLHLCSCGKKKDLWLFNVITGPDIRMCVVINAILRVIDGCLMKSWILTSICCSGFCHPASAFSPPTCPVLLSGRWAHGYRQGSLWQVRAGAIAAHTVHIREEVPPHLLAGTHPSVASLNTLFHVFTCIHPSLQQSTYLSMIVC